jgi:pimeloyl-ACP methyl ester carboxylesterase
MDTLTMLEPKIAKIYRDVPQESLRHLLAFRQRYPYQTATIDGRKWRFLDTRRGETVLFIPAGGTMVAELSFRSIEHFAGQYRVISPDYPPIDNLHQLFEGFIALLDYLGVDKFCLMGGSYGGWIAQSFVRHSPERVQKLILTAIGPPNPENSRQLARMMRWLRIMPAFLLRALIKRSFSRLVSDKSDDPDATFLWAHLQEVMAEQVQRADILAGLQRLIDQTSNYTFAPGDLESWSGRILMLFGADDPATPPEKREAMQKLYPQAEVKVFEGADHSMAVSHREAYYGMIDAFLA